METPTQSAWKVPVTWFALFNLLVVPVLGRVLWHFMLLMNNDEQRIGAIVLSLAGTIGILLVNCLLSRRARLAGLSGVGLQAMWITTGITFMITIGFGFFSPINMLIGFLRFGAGG